MSAHMSLKARLSEAVTRIWYQSKLHPLFTLFLPLSALVARVARRRLTDFKQNPPPPLSVPVIVVGNMTAGGTGKTPLVASLVSRLQAKGYKPGIISRGYASGKNSQPLIVKADSDPRLGGDEPVMLAGLTGVPVVVDPERKRGVEYLLQHSDCNIVISDDGLQHFRLHRDIEIVVVDGNRMFGNGHCLPVGPLREPLERLGEVDFLVCNGKPADSLPNSLPNSLPKGLRHAPATMNLVAAPLRPVSGKVQASFPGIGETVYGVAGIGNPERFFLTLEGLGYGVARHPFPDHHAFVADDLSFQEGRAVIMTAKDAVKCRSFAQDNWWYLPVEAQLPESFWDAFFKRLTEI